VSHIRIYSIYLLINQIRVSDIIQIRCYKMTILECAWYCCSD